MSPCSNTCILTYVDNGNLKVRSSVAQNLSQCAEIVFDVTFIKTQFTIVVTFSEVQVWLKCQAHQQNLWISELPTSSYNPCFHRTIRTDNSSVGGRFMSATFICFILHCWIRGACKDNNKKCISDSLTINGPGILSTSILGPEQLCATLLQADEAALGRIIL